MVAIGRLRTNREFEWLGAVCRVRRRGRRRSPREAARRVRSSAAARPGRLHGLVLFGRCGVGGRAS
jgi:hypothetical protein